MLSQIEDEPFFREYPSEKIFATDLYELREEDLLTLSYTMYSLESNFQELYEGLNSERYLFICSSPDGSKKSDFLTRLHNYVASVYSFRECIKNLTSMYYDTEIYLEKKREYYISSFSDGFTVPKAIQQPCRVLTELRKLLQHNKLDSISIEVAGKHQIIATLEVSDFINHSDYNRERTALNALPRKDDVNISSEVCRFHNRTRWMIYDTFQNVWSNQKGEFPR